MQLYEYRNGVKLSTHAAANFVRGELATALRKVRSLSTSSRPPSPTLPPALQCARLLNTRERNATLCYFRGFRTSLESSRRLSTCRPVVATDNRESSAAPRLFQTSDRDSLSPSPK